MFIHGREAYRRNCFLMKYTFYKNIVYVFAQYIFGFWSTFSGQTLYEALIYQAYNISMTSLPIMWYALFDFEYLKGPADPKDEPQSNKKVQNNSSGSITEEEDQLLCPQAQVRVRVAPTFMTHPGLYRIGMESRCYGMASFTQWFFYGVWHATLCYFACLYFIAYPGEAVESKTG